MMKQKTAKISERNGTAMTPDCGATCVTAPACIIEIRFWD
jgi:hypothetical protein